MTNKITSKTKIDKIVEANEKAPEILMNAGMGCLGCAMAQHETLEEGCLAHGMSKDEIKKIVDRLNE